MEKFFDENTYGIIETEPLVLAIWEETEPTRIIYMFDPNSRGPSGMSHSPNGAACVLAFDNIKLASEHFMSLIPDQLDVNFTIRPVEVVVGKLKRVPRPKCLPSLKPTKLSRLERKKLRREVSDVQFLAFLYDKLKLC